jgi:hypothetical protein
VLPEKNLMAKDYTKLRELLLAQERFPLQYLHKFIGKNTPSFDQGVADWQAQHPLAVCQSNRLSRNGGHRAMTYVFTAGTVDELISMLEATDRITDLLMVL